MRTLSLLILLCAGVYLVSAGGCLPPAEGCKCTFPGYPCYNSFSYGCKNRYCWAQCTAVLAGCKEWCYTKYESTGNYITCEKNEDCKDAADCSKAECSGGCTLAHGYERYRHLMMEILRNVD